MMQNIILKCIESKPENRYQTAVECKEALQEFKHLLILAERGCDDV